MEQIIPTIQAQVPALVPATLNVEKKVEDKKVANKEITKVTPNLEYTPIQRGLRKILAVALVFLSAAFAFIPLAFTGVRNTISSLMNENLTPAGLASAKVLQFTQPSVAPLSLTEAQAFATLERLHAEEQAAPVVAAPIAAPIAAAQREIDSVALALTIGTSGKPIDFSKKEAMIKQFRNKQALESRKANHANYTIDAIAKRVVNDTNMKTVESRYMGK